MSRKLKLMVLGNCTHYSISEALKASGVFETVTSAAIFSMTDPDRDLLASKLGAYDMIISLEHSAWAGSLATTALRERLGEQLITLPTPFFSGLFPDKAYLHYDGEIFRCPAIVGDYHSALLLEEVKSGIPHQEIVQRYVSGESFERLNIQGIWDDSLAELKKREIHTDIVLSDFIEKTIANGTISSQFLSFNHPAEGLINHIAVQIIYRIIGRRIDMPLMTRERHNLYAGPQWPLHFIVADRLGLPRPSEIRFKRPISLGGEWIELDEFARLSVDFFTQNKKPENFKIVTPHYLKTNIKF